MLSIREKFIALVDNDCIRKSDAIILLEGDGKNRYVKACQLFQSGMADKIVFSGGIIDYSYGSFPFTDIEPLLLSEGIPSDAIIHESKSQSTKEQAKEVIKLAIKNDWKSLILIASHYHQYRAYLTFLNEVIGSPYKIVIYNASASNLFWFEDNKWGKRIDLIDDEFVKIEKYSSRSHLATMEQAIDYQLWKENLQ
jgi:uncharacterized SAM-binding protein YcdF (DUF218 family)